MGDSNAPILQDSHSSHPWDWNRSSIAESTNITDDGRIDVSVDSRLARTLSRLIPNQRGCLRSAPNLPPEVDWRVKLNIVIQVIGSRGDVQPFVALGQELQKHGHRIRLATHDVFEDFVRSAGLEFYPTGGDPAELMSYMVKNPGLIPNLTSVRAGEIQRKRVMIQEMLHGCWNSCLEPDQRTKDPFVADAIIANPPSFAHVHCAQALSIPVHLIFTMPWSSTKAFPHPLANLKNSSADPKILNYLTYGIVDFLTWQGLGDVVNQWRRQTLQLEPVPSTEGPFLLGTLLIPITYCWSPSLIPKPTDWPAHIDVCGFFFRDTPSYLPSQELQEYLDAGPPPIYIGFGSIVIDDPDGMTAILHAAVKSAGVRAIISRGWSKLGGDDVPHVFYLDECPHEWLFQHVSAVVHHGGAGTTACGLRFGKPTTIVPFFGDQLFWGNMVAAAGAGPKPIPHKTLTSRNLAKAIFYCLTDEAIMAAQTLSAKMNMESGVKAAVRSFHAHLPLETLQCDMVPDQTASWDFETGSKRIKLSKIAVSILNESGMLGQKDLRLHKPKPIFIDNRRWDPVTAVSSASIAIAGEVVDGAVGIFTKPYEEYKRSQNNPRTSSENQHPLISTPHPSESASGVPPTAFPSPTSKKKNSKSTASAMATASATSLGRLAVSLSKGTLVSIPIALTDGLRSIPQLYNHEVKVYEPITDWKSGIVVAGKNFGRGMYEGVTDIFMQTYERKKREGTKGVAKGLGSGLVSLGAKTTAGVVGLVAYPAKGVSMSIRSAVRGGVGRRIEAAKWKEGLWLAGRKRGLVDPVLLVAEFERRGS